MGFYRHLFAKARSAKWNNKAHAGRIVCEIFGIYVFIIVALHVRHVSGQAREFCRNPCDQVR